MTVFGRCMMEIICCSVLGVGIVSAQDAILPQGDPRQQELDASKREEIRKNRLKQQGQGEQYRVEGERQGATHRSSPEQSLPLVREETGLADPSVNPGQASGMKSIRGHVIKSEGKTHTVRQLSGEDTVLTVDDYTRGDTELHLGDHITSTLTPQGRAVIVKKDQLKH